MHCITFTRIIHELGYCLFGFKSYKKLCRLYQYGMDIGEYFKGFISPKPSLTGLMLKPCALNQIKLDTACAY